MRILILSDLHHELWKTSAPRIDISVSKPDVVILAGDINMGAKAVQWASQQFAGTPVIYVQGNHESYGQNLESAQSSIRAAAQATENVHFLDCDEHIIGNVRFLGATMWTDFRLFGDHNRSACMHEAAGVMNDYKRIRLASEGYRKLRPADTAKFHAVQKSWLSKKLGDRFDGTTVVITHMAPSMLSVPSEYKGDRVSAAYASNLENLVSQANLWVHGHMHESCDYAIDNCRVVCNPCGYMTRGGGIENPEFDANFFVDLPELSAGA